MSLRLVKLVLSCLYQYVPRHGEISQKDYFQVQDNVLCQFRV